MNHLYEYITLTVLLLLLAASVFLYMQHKRQQKTIEQLEQMNLHSRQELEAQTGLTFRSHKEQESFICTMAAGKLLDMLWANSSAKPATSEEYTEDADNYVVQGRNIGWPAPGLMQKKPFEQAWRGEQSIYETWCNGLVLLIVLEPVRNDEGEVCSILGTATDITQHYDAKRLVRESEERYSNILDNSQDLILGLLADGSILTFNQRFMHLMQLQSKQDILDLRIQSLLSPAARELWDYHLRQTVVRHSKQQFEMIWNLNETDRHWLVTLSPYHRTEGHQLGITAICHDITDWRKREEADAANVAKGQFLARMSHEIRTPLNGMIGLVSLLHKTELNHIQQDYVNKLSSTSDSLLDIINDILDVSKIEAGKLKLESVSFRLEDTITKVADTFSLLLGSKPVTVSIDTPANLPKRMIGDPTRLEQILTNLCSNAVKFTDAGSIDLKLTYKELTTDQIQLDISMKDTGIGMTAEQIDRLFIPFTQADSSTTRKYGGTGLGLVICKHLTEAMNGDLRVQSLYGDGTTFTLSIPLEIVREEGYEQWNLPQEALGSCWIVDEVDSDHLQYLLRPYGFFIKRLSSLQQLYQTAKIKPPAKGDLLIVSYDEWDNRLHTDEWLHLCGFTNKHGLKLLAITTIRGREALMRLQQRCMAADTILLNPLTRQSLHDGLSFRNKSSITNWNSSKEVAASAALNVDVREGIADAPPSSKGHILIAEDNKVNQLVIMHLLQHFGYEVTLATNGEDLIKRLTDEPWRLIILDLNMPVMDGYEAMSNLRTRPEVSHIPVIALTANIMKYDHERCLNLGMKDVLTKPINEDQLQVILDTWCTDSTVLTTSVVEEKSPSQVSCVIHQETVLDPSPPRMRGVDYERLLDKLSGRSHIASHALELFEREYISYSTQVMQAIADQKPRDARRLAHTLRGVASNLCADDLLELATQLETALQLLLKDDAPVHTAEEKTSSISTTADVDALIQEIQTEIHYIIANRQDK